MKLTTVYDIDKTIELTDRYINALKELMAAECEMMQQGDSGFAGCWTWGRATVGDLAFQHLEFEFGSDEDLPGDGLGRFGVIVEQPKPDSKP